MTDRRISWILMFLIIVNKYCICDGFLTPAEQQVQLCLNQDVTRQPVIIDTDTYIDDLWAIHYALNVPTINVLAITTVGDAYSQPFYSGSNVLSFLDLIGCSSGVGVGYGLSLSLLSSGYVIPLSLLTTSDAYMTASTCLNQSVNIFLQPSPFNAIELIKLTLKYSKIPVDILVLGTMTNIATAISEDRSIVSKIGTLYFSGGQFKTMASYPTLTPDLSVFNYPYATETLDSSPNAYLDVLAVQRVGASGIKNMVAMPLSTQNTLTVNITQVAALMTQFNLPLKPFVFSFITSLARCTNQSEEEIKWWDNSAAQFMVQMQTNNTQGFCTQTQKVRSLYILSADAHQLYGQGMIDVESKIRYPDVLVNYTICTQANTELFLIEFLTKISAGNLYSCTQQYNQRFDVKLQQCMMKFQDYTNMATTNHFLSIYLFCMLLLLCIK